MTIADIKQTAVILIDCEDSVGDDAYFNTAAPQNNVLVFNCSTTGYIEPLLSALRAHYEKFNAVSFVTNNAVIHTELTQFFPELFRGIRFIDQLQLPLTKTDMTELMSVAMTLPPFELVPDEPLVSAEFERLKNFFLLDERLTDISEQDSISQLTDAFLAAVSAQHCAFSAFVQIRLLSFYSAKLNKYGDAYFKSLSLKCGDGNVSAAQLWQLVSALRYNANERLFIYNQVLSMEFGGILKTKSDFNIRFRAYKSVVDSFSAQLNMQEKFIPSQSRNSDIVFVFIAQFLSPRHAPSKIALDIIKSLCLLAKKQVVLIDTCELLPRRGAIPWYDSAFGTRGQFQTDTLTYEGANFSYLQLSAGMPNKDEIIGIVDLIKNYKPYFAITVGESVTADICSQLIPNVVVPTIARLPHTLGQFRLADASILPDNCAIKSDLFYQGIVDFRVVPDIAENTQQGARMQQLPLQIAIVGNRLDAELDNTFFDFLLELMPLPVYFVFVGEFSQFPKWCLRYPVLQERATVLGYQSELVSALSQFDVFLNYPRMGGGNSALYAMRAGLPVLTLKQGDVYAVAGAAFGLNSYSEIKQELSRMTLDLTYLSLRAELARQKAAEIIDQRSDINTLIRMLSASPLFDYAGFLHAKLEIEGVNGDEK